MSDTTAELSAASRSAARTIADEAIRNAREVHFAFVEAKLWRDKKRLESLRDYWMNVFNAVRYIAGRDYSDLARYRAMCANMGVANKFYTSEEWGKEAQHLIAEEKRLESVIGTEWELI